MITKNCEMIAVVKMLIAYCFDIMNTQNRIFLKATISAHVAMNYQTLWLDVSSTKFFDAFFYNALNIFTWKVLWRRSFVGGMEDQFQSTISSIHQVMSFPSHKFPD